MSQTASPKVIAIVGAKGGTGKSMLCANVGLYLATLGKRVVLVDAVLGGANLHMFLGELPTQRSVGEVLGKNCQLKEIIEPTPVPGLRIAAGERNQIDFPAVGGQEAGDFLAQVHTLDADLVVIDAGSGTSAFALDLALAADIAVLLSTPDPASVELFYRSVRAAFVRRLVQADLFSAVAQLQLCGFAEGLLSPSDLYHCLSEDDPDLADLVQAQILGLRPSLVINCARSKADMTLGASMAIAGRRRLGVPISYLGYLEYDEAAWASLRRRRPLLVEYPESRVGKCIEKIARRLLSWGGDRLALDLCVQENYYELLDVAPTASFEDIRRANRRIREVYSPESLVMTGLYSIESLQALGERIDSAYRTLMDANLRKEYDQVLFPNGVPSQEKSMLYQQPSGDPLASGTEPAKDRPPMPELTPATEYSGSVLQRVRMAQGIDLREIAERSKIGMAYLQALEKERFHKLPAPVYVRGFLAEYSRIVGLDQELVVESYLERYRAAKMVQPEG